MTQREVTTPEDLALGVKVFIDGAPKMKREELDLGPPVEEDIWLLEVGEYEQAYIEGAYRTVKIALRHNPGVWTYLAHGRRRGEWYGSWYCDGGSLISCPLAEE